MRIRHSPVFCIPASCKILCPGEPGGGFLRSPFTDGVRVFLQEPVFSREQISPVWARAYSVWEPAWAQAYSAWVRVCDVWEPVWVRVCDVWGAAEEDRVCGDGDDVYSCTEVPQRYRKEHKGFFSCYSFLSEK